MRTEYEMPLNTTDDETLIDTTDDGELIDPTDNKVLIDPTDDEILIDPEIPVADDILNDTTSKTTCARYHPFLFILIIFKIMFC